MKLVETIRTIYKELFTINFDHSGYEVERNMMLPDDISLQPDKDTRAHFKNYEMDYRFDSSTLICFIRCNLFSPPSSEPKIPFRKVSNDLRLRFLLKSGTSFINKTALAEAGAREVYYFSNRVNAGTSMFISNNTMEVGDNDLKSISAVEPEETCLGVIDIFSSNAQNSNYELFTGTAQQLRSPAYRIRFRSIV